MQCKDKVAIVTGAAGRGMGRSIALTLAREGAKVVVNYRTSADQARDIATHIRDCGGEAIAVQADIFQSLDCRRLIETAQTEYSRVDICVIGPGAGWQPDPLEALDPAAALDNAQREIAPLFNLMPLVLPGMYERRWGRLIGIAMHPTKIPPAYAYNAAKSARLHALLLAHEQAWRHGVTVNVIAPGPVAALDSFDEAIDQCDHRDAWDQRPNVSPQDIAEGVAFLCSDAGRFITGAVLPYLFN